MDDQKVTSSAGDIGQPLEKCKSPLRWVILVLGCLMMVGSYYCFDIPAALKTQIDDYMGNPSNYELQFSLMYTLYAAPNVIIPFFGGMLVDRMGVRFSLLLFASTITLGQAIFSLGISTKSWTIILLGRFVFGLGGESFTVANSALLADWFKGKELALAFGVNLSISKLGSVINNIVSPALANSASIVFALWFGTMLCGACVVCVLIMIPIDREMDRAIAERQGRYAMVSSVNGLVEDGSDSVRDEDKISKSTEGKSSAVAVVDYDVTSEDSEESQIVSFRDALTFAHVFWILVASALVVYGCVLPFNNISSALLLERDYFKVPPSECHLLNEYECEGDKNPPVDCPSSEWYQPPLPYNQTIGGTYYPDQLTANDIDCTDSDWSDDCTSEFCDRQTKAQTQASFIMSIPYVISAVLSPPLGYFIDIFGLRAVFATIAPLILIIVHYLFAFTSVSPIGPMIGQGIAYTGYVSCLWPSIPVVVEERLTGLAFGIATSMQNLSCAIIPLLVALIYSASDDEYIPNVEILFMSLGIAGTIIGLYMNFHDYFYCNSVLNKPDQVSEMKHTSFSSAGADVEEDREGDVLSPVFKGGSHGTLQRPLLPDKEVPAPEGGGSGESTEGEDDLGDRIWAERSPNQSVDHGRASRNASRDRYHSRDSEGLHHRHHSKGGRGKSFSAYEEAFKGGAFHHHS